MSEDRMLKWFEGLDPISGHSFLRFRALALSICQDFEPGPERTVALRKLLESKDAAVRAAVHPGG